VHWHSRVRSPILVLRSLAPSLSLLETLPRVVHDRVVAGEVLHTHTTATRESGRNTTELRCSFFRAFSSLFMQIRKTECGVGSPPPYRGMHTMTGHARRHVRTPNYQLLHTTRSHTGHARYGQLKANLTAKTLTNSNTHDQASRFIQQSLGLSAHSPFEFQHPLRLLPAAFFYAS
jgi:hypothetical protein